MRFLWVLTMSSSHYSIICALLMLISSAACASVIEIYEFSDEKLHDRYQSLIAELRCPKCQNQNLAGSDSPISADLRAQVRDLLEDGASDQEIKDYLVARYGVFVLYNPPASGNTLLVWIIPFVLLSVGVVTALIILKSRLRPSLQVDEDFAVGTSNPTIP